MCVCVPTTIDTRHCQEDIYLSNAVRMLGNSRLLRQIDMTCYTGSAQRAGDYGRPLAVNS